jgi:hypothetical protein
MGKDDDVFHADDGPRIWQRSDRLRDESLGDGPRLPVDRQGDGWSLEGNGALIVPLVAVPLVIAIGSHLLVRHSGPAHRKTVVAGACLALPGRGASWAVPGRLASAPQSAWKTRRSKAVLVLRSLSVPQR